MAVGAKGSFKEQPSHYLFSTASLKDTIYLPKAENRSYCSFNV